MANFQTADPSSLCDLASAVKEANDKGASRADIHADLLALGMHRASIDRLIDRALHQATKFETGTGIAEQRLMDLEAAQAAIHERVSGHRAAMGVLRDAHEFNRKFPAPVTLPKNLIFGAPEDPGSQADLKYLVHGQLGNANKLTVTDMMQLGCSRADAHRLRETLDCLSGMASTRASERTALGLLKSSQKIALYLRSFEDDVSSKPSLWGMVPKLPWQTGVEQKIIAELNTYGDFVAIGMPGDDSDRDGEAARIFVGDNWQDIVRLMMVRADIVVLRMNSSPGIVWELEQCLKLVLPHRLLIIFPPKSEFPASERTEGRERLYDQVCRNIEQFPMFTRPRQIDVPNILGFDHNGIPKYMPSYDHLHVAMTHAMAEEHNRVIMTAI